MKSYVKWTLEKLGSEEEEIEEEEIVEEEKEEEKEPQEVGEEEKEEEDEPPKANDFSKVSWDRTKQISHLCYISRCINFVDPILHSNLKFFPINRSRDQCVNKWKKLTEETSVTCTHGPPCRLDLIRKVEDTKLKGNVKNMDEALKEAADLSSLTALLSIKRTFGNPENEEREIEEEEPREVDEEEVVEEEKEPQEVGEEEREEKDEPPKANDFSNVSYGLCFWYMAFTLCDN